MGGEQEPSRERERERGGWGGGGVERETEGGERELAGSKSKKKKEPAAHMHIPKGAGSRASCRQQAQDYTGERVSVRERETEENRFRAALMLHLFGGSSMQVGVG